MFLTHLYLRSQYPLFKLLIVISTDGSIAHTRNLPQGPEDNFHRKWLDACGTALLDGAREDDGGGSGQALRTTGDGSCFFNAVALGAWGKGVAATTATDTLALPLRLATVRDGFLKLEKHLASSGDTSIRLASAYDDDVFTEAVDLGVNLERAHWPSANAPDNRVILTKEIARAMAVIALVQVSHENGWATVCCLPLVAESLNINVRCFNPGEA